MTIMSSSLKRLQTLQDAKVRRCSSDIFWRKDGKLVPDDAVDDPPILLEKVKLGEHIVDFETTDRLKDGSLGRVSLSFSPTKNADGEIAGAAGIAHAIPSDIAEDPKHAISEVSERSTLD